MNMVCGPMTKLEAFIKPTNLLFGPGLVKDIHKTSMIILELLIPDPDPDPDPTGNL